MYIAYIYDINGTVVAQVEEILDFETQLKLNDISTASFGLYHTNEYCKREYLKEYRRVVINQQIWNTEKTVFDWVIRWFDADLTKTSIKLESFEHLFDRRLLHLDYTFTDQSIQTILSTILWEINTRFATGITLDCGITTTTTKEYKKGETFLKVLKDLAWNGFEFIVKDKVLIFKETIGIDRSTGENFVQFRYDINEPDDRSINSVKMTVDWKELANWVIWKSWSNFTEIDDPTSIADYWLIEASFSNSWDDASATQSYLDDHKNSLSEYEVETISNDFFEADLGDMVSVYVYIWNDIMFFDWSMKVIQKNFNSWDLARVQYVLWKSKVQSKNFIEQISDMQARLKTVELK